MATATFGRYPQGSMALTISPGVAPFPVAWSGSPDRWLISLRWIAIGGMLSTTLVARSVLPALDVRPVIALLGLVVLVNLGWIATVRVRERQERKAGTIGAQLLGDVVLVALLLWCSGGLDNPFAGFLTFQIALAGLLASRRVTWAVAGLSLLLAVPLYWARPLPFESSPYGAHAVRSVGALLAVITLGAFIGICVVVFARRLRALREEAERAERLAGLGRTVAAMCHELNTPLGTILLASKDLGEIGKELGQGEVSALAFTVSEQARRAADVIALLRGHVGQGTERELVDLADFVPGYAQAELDRLGFTGQREIVVTGPLPARVFRAALCQILTNLLANSVDATSAVTTPRIAVTGGRVRDGLCVAISDNGCGVAPDLLPHLGEPFRTTKQQRGGSGLGLYASSLLAERMGGTLSLDSHAGRGTTVTLTLDPAEETTDAPHPDRAAR